MIFFNVFYFKTFNYSELLFVFCFIVMSVRMASHYSVIHLDSQTLPPEAHKLYLWNFLKYTNVNKKNNNVLLFAKGNKIIIGYWCRLIDFHIVHPLYQDIETPKFKTNKVIKTVEDHQALMFCEGKLPFWPKKSGGFQESTDGYNHFSFS